MQELYKVIRHYENGRKSRVMRRNLSLAEAQKHCNDPETSSMTARKPRGCDGDQAQIDRWHETQKHWFDGYERQ